MEDAHVIICENPKHSFKLLNNLGIKKKLISLHDYNEKLIVERLREELKNKIVVLISDAGSPLISDPGYKLVQYCIKNNLYISTVPGPSAIIPALQLSGLPINEFFYAGFLPKTKKHIIDFIDKIDSINKTSVFFVSSHRVEICLKILEDKLNNRSVSVAKEITKLNEKVFRGNIKNIRREIIDKKINLKGEFVFVVGEKSDKKIDFIDLETSYEEIDKLLKKFSLTDVAQIVHKLSGINKNKVYKWLLKLKKS